MEGIYLKFMLFYKFILKVVICISKIMIVINKVRIGFE